MRIRLFTGSALIMGLAITLTWAVAAQGTEIPSLPQYDNSRQLSPIVDLGEPGLSFRYVQPFGVTGESYPADTDHINSPAGLFIDGSDNLFVTEGMGYRVLKYNSIGDNTLVLGVAGLSVTGDSTFEHPRDIAMDGDGNIWVADNNRVVQYDHDGDFLQTLPETDSWMSGDDNTHFDEASGVAFDSTGQMFVSDNENCTSSEHLGQK